MNNDELYDVKADPGETQNVNTAHPDVVDSLRAAYDTWWNETLPLLVNESAVGTNINPMTELYWKQFGGGPDAKMLEKMNPTKKASAEEIDKARKPSKQNQRKDKKQS